MTKFKKKRKIKVSQITMIANLKKIRANLKKMRFKKKRKIKANQMKKNIRAIFKEERYCSDSNGKHKENKERTFEQDYKKKEVKKTPASNQNDQKYSKNESSTNKTNQSDDDSNSKEASSQKQSSSENTSKNKNYKAEFLKWVEETKGEHKRIMKIAHDSAAREEAMLLEKLHTLNPLDSSALKVIEQLYHIDYPLTLQLFEEILRLTNQTLSIPVQDAAFDVMKQILSRDDVTKVIDTSKIIDE